MSRKEELEQLITVARAELDEIRFKEEKAVSANLVGKCFKYRNYYSCPENEGDYWWEYAKIMGYDGGYLDAIIFTLGIDQIEFKVSSAVLSNSLCGWIEITQEEFNEAWRSLTAELEKIRETLK